MLRLLKYSFIVSALVMNSAFAAPRNVEDAKDLYIKLFNPAQTQEGVKFINADIARLLLEDSEKIKDQKESLESFANEIQQLNIGEIINSYNISPNEVPQYADNLARRMVALGIEIDKHSDEVKQLSANTKMIYGALIGLATGVLMGRVMLSSSDSSASAGRVFLTLSGTIIGTSSGLALDEYDKHGDKKSMKKIMDELNKIAQKNVQKLKGSKVEKTINALE